MKKQIIVPSNLIILQDGTNISVDCSRFDFRFCEISNTSRWVEKIPFRGKEQLKSWTEVESFIASAMAANKIETPTEEPFIPTAEEYKEYYLEIFNAKLKELDYDSIATVNVWAAKIGSKYYVQANGLSDWYIAIINKNEELLSNIKNEIIPIPTKEEYLALLPKFEDFEV
jgi:hypothetical protein